MGDIRLCVGTPAGKKLYNQGCMYDPDFHSYMVFDNVNDMECVMDCRAMFQANNDIHVLGKSKMACTLMRCG